MCPEPLRDDYGETARACRGANPVRCYKSWGYGCARRGSKLLCDSCRWAKWVKGTPIPAQEVNSKPPA